MSNRKLYTDIHTKTVDNDGRTPLHDAAQSGIENEPFTLATLIFGGANVNAVDKNGRTPLHDAAHSSSERASLIVKELIALGADVNAVDEDGRTPLHGATQSGIEGRGFIIEELIAGGSDVTMVDKYGRTPLHNAAHSSAEEARFIIKKLIKAGANVKAIDKDGRTPLHDAAQLSAREPYSTVWELIEGGADVKAVDKDGRTPLHDAARSSARQAYFTVWELVKGGADVKVADIYGRTPLHDAAQSSAEDASFIVRELLEGGADVKAVDIDGRTPLHNAAQSSSEEVSFIVEMLIEGGADVKAVDKRDRTSLHNATQSIAEDANFIVGELIRGGADVNAVDKNGRTPFHNAAQLSAGEVSFMIGILIEEGADIDAVDEDSQTPALLLLQLGMDPTLVIKLWQFHKDPIIQKNVPGYLELWANTMAGFEYGTIRTLIHEISIADSYVNLDCISWEWEVPLVMRPSYENGNVDQDGAQIFSNDDVILVRTNLRDALGEETECMRATTCNEYLRLDSWVEFITELLDVMNVTELDLTHYGFSICALESPFISVTCTFTTLSIYFGNKRGLKRAADLIEALDWLCKCTRIPTTQNSLDVSSASYHIKRSRVTGQTQGSPEEIPKAQIYALTPIISLKITPLPTPKHNCWLSLFDSGIVVDSPLYTSHDFGKGLESTFDLMISLAAAEFCLRINGGLVFVGYQTVLYPVAIQDDCAQFHLITCKDGQINPYTLDLGNRVLTEDPSQFIKMRCFLGWCEEAQINLGTRQLPATIGYSGGRDQSRSLQSDGYSILGQFGASAPLSSILGLQKNFRYNRHRIRFTPANNYLKLLCDTSQQLAIVYDAGQRRCWLVPKLSVLLHMSQAYVSSFDGVSNANVPFVDPHADATQLVEILESFSDVSVFQGQTNKLLFRELMLGLAVNLLDTVDAIRESSGKKLYGFEFMDVVNDLGGGTCMKRLDILSKGNAWLDVANAVGTVIVCSELGEAITAVEGSTRRSLKCNVLPRGHDYLAATLPCLTRLVKRRGIELNAAGNHISIAEKISWRVTGDPFTSCQHDGSSNDTCWEKSGFVQQVVQKRRLRDLQRTAQTLPLPQLPRNGAVVFGKQ